MKKLLFILLCVPLIGFGQTQLEMNMSSCEKFQERDKELNLVYNYIIDLYSIDTVFIEKLRFTQNNWIK